MVAKFKLKHYVLAKRVETARSLSSSRASRGPVGASSTGAIEDTGELRRGLADGLRACRIALWRPYPAAGQNICALIAKSAASAETSPKITRHRLSSRTARRVA